MAAQPLTFSFILFGSLAMLIGGCMWGTGENGGNSLVYGFGLFFFAVGCLLLLIGSVLRIYRHVKDNKRKEKALKKNLQGLDNPMALTITDGRPPPSEEKSWHDPAHDSTVTEETERRAASDTENSSLESSDEETLCHQRSEQTPSVSKIFILPRSEDEASRGSVHQKEEQTSNDLEISSEFKISRDPVKNQSEEQELDDLKMFTVVRSQAEISPESGNQREERASSDLEVSSEDEISRDPVKNQSEEQELDDLKMFTVVRNETAVSPESGNQREERVSSDLEISSVELDKDESSRDSVDEMERQASYTSDASLRVESEDGLSDDSQFNPQPS